MDRAGGPVARACGAYGLPLLIGSGAGVDFTAGFGTWDGASGTFSPGEMWRTFAEGGTDRVDGPTELCLDEAVDGFCEGGSASWDVGASLDDGTGLDDGGFWRLSKKSVVTVWFLAEVDACPSAAAEKGVSCSVREYGVSAT